MEENNKYQVMPDLSHDEFEDLKADIAERGVQVPIEFDENGAVIDGYHRLRACQELSIEDYPRVIRAGLSENEKIEHALALNVARRSLTPGQKVEIAKALKEKHPEWPVVKIAKMLHVDVRSLDGQLMDFHNLPTVEGEDGKQYPASEKVAEQKREEIRDEIEKHPEKSDREIAKEKGVSHHTVGTQRKKMFTAYNPSKRDEQALKDPDIVERLASGKSLSVAGALKEQKRERLSSKPDADDNKGIDVIITPANDIPGVAGCRILRADAKDDSRAGMYNMVNPTDDEEAFRDVKAEMYNTDCLKYMKNVPDESIDLVIADPPYFEVWGDFDFVWDSEAEYLEWIHECLREFARILKPTGTLMLWGTLGGNHLTLCKVMLWVEENGLFIKKNMITQRNTRSTGVQDNYMSCREDLLFYTKSDSYTFNVPHTDEISDRADLGANEKLRGSDYKRASNVWCDITEASQSSSERCFHPTTKALRLCDRIIQTHSNEGDLIFIPYTGSGSEVTSCIKNNRQFIGTEISSDYFNKSIERIEVLFSKEPC